MATKKTPLRMCVGCREMKSKQELIRIVKTPENEIVFDPTGKKNGRGAYICKKAECLQKAEKINALSHAFGGNVDKEIYARLKGEQESLEG